MEFLDKLDTGMLVLFAVVMALAPFSPEPHLVEKYRMFREGTLHKGIDLFDVFWHLLPTLLLAAKLLRDWSR